MFGAPVNSGALSVWCGRAFLRHRRLAGSAVAGLLKAGRTG